MQKKIEDLEALQRIGERNQETEMRRMLSKVADMPSDEQKLKAKIASQQATIDHLKSVLNGQEISVPKRMSKGRPSISEEQKRRIREYRSAGWTIKQIAEQEGLSVGVVSKICKKLLTTNGNHE